MLIGLDLDNTIIRYDRLLHSIAVERRLIATSAVHDKRIIRDLVRDKYGDMEWQRLQVAIYGTDICRAELMDGVFDFLNRLKKTGHNFRIISHKTRYPNNGESSTDLRAAAMDFLAGHGFFSTSGLDLSEKDIFFLATRKEKVQTIRDLKPAVFIDDLKEVYMEPDFPAETIKILFSTEKRHGLPGVRTMATFVEISNYFFKGAANGSIRS